MADERYYDENSEQSKEIVAREGIKAKLVRNGLIAATLLGVSKAAKGTKYGNILNSDGFKFGVAAVSAVALNRDDDIGGDIITASSFVLAGSKLNMMKHAIEDADEYQKLWKKIKKADDVSKSVSLFTMNFKDKTIDSFVGNFSKNLKTNKEDNLLVTALSYGKAGVLGIGETLLEPFKAIGEKGLVDGIKHNVKAMGSSKYYEDYLLIKETAEVDMINEISRKTSSLNGMFNFYDGDAGMVRKGLEAIAKRAGHEGLFNDITNSESLENFKRFRKFNQIESSTTFTDMLGMFTKYDEATGRVNADLGKILGGDQNNIKMLQSLSSKFEREARSNIRGYSKLDDDVKESMFVDFLNKNGFEDLVNKSYGKDNHLKIGEINNRIAGKYVNDLSDLDTEEQIINRAYSTGRITEDDFNKGIAEITKKRNNQVDSEMEELISKNIGGKFLESTETSHDNNFIIGIKNNNLIKNFSVTNAIEKTANGYRDNTALDGSIMAWKLAGIVEKNGMGMYKNPIMKNLELWNPFKLIESEKRIKGIIANDYLQFGEMDNGFFSNGKMIQWMGGTYDATDGSGRTLYKNGKVVEKYKNLFFTDDSQSYKMTFLKQHRDIMDENYLVHNDNRKSVKSYSGMYSTVKEKGFKAGVEEFMSSHSNPTSFRYTKGEGFRLADHSESYYASGHLLGGIHNNNINDSNVLGFLERNGKKSKVANLLFGEAGDINVRHLEIDNKNVEDKAKIAIKILLEENYKKLTDIKTINPNYDIDDKFIFKHGKEVVASGFEDMLDFEKNGMSKEFTFDEKSSLTYMRDLIKKGVSKAEFNELTTKTMKGKQLENGANFTLSAFSKNDEYNKRFFNLIDMHYDGQLGIVKSTNENFSEYTEWMWKIRHNSNNKRYGKRVTDMAIEIIDANKLIQSNASTLEGMGYNMENFGMVLLKDKPGEQSGTLVKRYNKFINEIIDDQKKAKNSIDEAILKNQAIRNTKIKKYTSGLDYSEGDELSNPVKNIYNTSLGYEYNKTINNENSSIVLNSLKNGKTIADGISEQDYNNNQTARNLVNYFSSYDRDYSIGTLSKAYNYETGRTLKDDNYLSYKFLNKIRTESEALANSENAVDNNIFKAMEIIRNRNFTVRGDEIGAGLIVQSTLKRHLEISNVLESVREVVQSFMTKNNKGWKIAQYTENFNKSNQSQLFGETHSTFGIATKTPIHGLQNASEAIGIERIPGNELGSHWTTQYKNFFKHRVLPMTAMITGAIAVNSLSDALVPDDVPIFGNGIMGVGTRAYASARVGVQYGLKYTGMLAALRGLDNVIPGLVDNGLTWWLDPLMDPSEMIDVYFKGKAVRVNKNRNWYTAGRQTGEGEEFGEYRPHVLYTLGNPTAGIYDNKMEKFFREDFMVTKYPWYILDPYKEERDAYKKFGAKYPVTERMFRDMPVIGEFMSATLGEIIKPTQYMWENEWRVGENMMINPNYDHRNSSSPEYIEFTDPNRFAFAGFKAIRDLQQWGGLPGFASRILSEQIFGKSNPYENAITLSGIEEDISIRKAYDNLELGGMMGITEPIRRYLNDHDALGNINMNPILQDIPEYMPDYFRKGNNPFMKRAGAEHYLGGEYTEKTSNFVGNEDIDKLKVLSMIAPSSSEYKAIQGKVQRNLNSYSSKEKNSYFESLAYAERYGKREYHNNNDVANNLVNVNLKIDKILSPYEFISRGKRYKLDSVEQDFNALSEKHGQEKATRLMEQLSQTFKEKTTHTFRMSKDAVYSVGTDYDGDFIKLDSSEINRDLRGESVYNNRKGIADTLLAPFTFAMNRVKENPMPSYIEKVFGKKSAYAEWSQETVQSPYFRDWNDPIQSFVEPFYTFSANQAISAFAFNSYGNSVYMDSNADVNLLGITALAGTFMNPINKITGRVSKSSQYNDETKVQTELEKIKMLAGDKSYFNMTGQENIRQFSKMVNEQDSEFLMDLANTANKSEREKILATGNELTSNVLKTIWNRQQELIDNANSDNMYTIEKSKIDSATYIGAYDGNADLARTIIKNKLNVSHSKLDGKRIGVISSYRGGMSKSEAEYIKQKMYKTYNSRNAKVTSTIYPKGQININRREQ